MVHPHFVGPDVIVTLRAALQKVQSTRRYTHQLFPLLMTPFIFSFFVHIYLFLTCTNGTHQNLAQTKSCTQPMADYDGTLEPHNASASFPVFRASLFYRRPARATPGSLIVSHLHGPGSFNKLTFENMNTRSGAHECGAALASDALDAYSKARPIHPWPAK